MKIDEKMAKLIERDMKYFNYSTKTELLREAIREKLKKLDAERRKEKAWDKLFASRGILKGKGKAKTDEEFYRLRKEFSDDLYKEMAKKYGWKD